MSNKVSVNQIGGSVENALKGNYTINVKAIMREAWQSTQQSRVSINIAVFLTLIFGITISYVLSSSVGGIEAVLNDPEAVIVLKIIVTVFLAPFIAGIEMLGVLHAVKMKTKYSLIFSFLNRASWVALCALMTSLLISIGFQLFVLPGIFLAVVLSVTLPLIIEKKMKPAAAIVLSVKALRFKWLPILAIYSGLFFILTLSLMPAISMLESEIAPLGFMIFFFTLTYQIPLFYNVKGILYREIFGIYVVEEVKATHGYEEYEEKHFSHSSSAQSQESVDENIAESKDENQGETKEDNKAETKHSSNVSHLNESKKRVDKSDNDDIFTA
ncbi:MAG: hypothetical protein ACPGTQ_13455 [Colwellia sp.]